MESLELLYDSPLSVHEKTTYHLPFYQFTPHNHSIMLLRFSIGPLW